MQILWDTIDHTKINGLRTEENELIYPDPQLRRQVKEAEALRRRGRGRT